MWRYVMVVLGFKFASFVYLPLPPPPDDIVPHIFVMFAFELTPPCLYAKLFISLGPFETPPRRFIARVRVLRMLCSHKRTTPSPPSHVYKVLDKDNFMHI